MGGVLEDDINSSHLLLESFNLSVGKSDTIAQSIIAVVNKLTGPTDEFKQFKLFLTDGASNMTLAGKILKAVYPGFKHITCILHFLHLVSNKIFNRTPNYNSFISMFQSIFSHSPKRKRNYNLITNSKLPNFGVDTRWGTRLEFALYVAENSQMIIEYLTNVKDEITIATQILELFLKQDFSKELSYLEFFKNTIFAIKQLEGNTIEVWVVIKKLNEIKNLLKNNEKMLLFWNNWEAKNPDYKWFSKYSKYTCNYEDRIFYKAPLTTATVERSFSAMGSFMSNNRCSLSHENLGYYMLIYFNNRK